MPMGKEKMKNENNGIDNDKKQQNLKEILFNLKCNNEYRIRGSIDVGMYAIIHEEIWQIERLLESNRIGGYNDHKVDIDHHGKASKLPKNDYGYIEVEKCRQSLIFAVENLVKNYCWQNVLIINNLAKHSVSVLRIFFGKIKKEISKFESELSKIKEEAKATEDKIDCVFNKIKTTNNLQMVLSSGISIKLSSPFNAGSSGIKYFEFDEESKNNLIFGQTSYEIEDLVDEINYNNYLLDLFKGTCNNRDYFGIIKDFFALKLIRQMLQNG
jgi:hypothetical protein